MSLTSKNVINMTLTFNFDGLAFFGLGDVRDFHWQLWCLFSGSYSKIHVSSPVMTLRSKSGSVWRHSMMSWHTCMSRSIWSSFSSLGTIFVQTFHMPKSSVIIFQTLSFFKSIWLAIIRTVNRQSPCTTCFTHSTLTSVLLVEGLPLLESSSTSSHSALNLLCHSETHVSDMVLSPYTCSCISSACGGAFLNQTKMFRFIHCSVFIVSSSVIIAEGPEEEV